MAASRSSEPLRRGVYPRHSIGVAAAVMFGGTRSERLLPSQAAALRADLEQRGHVARHLESLGRELRLIPPQ
jgi:hypothetical protein